MDEQDPPYEIGYGKPPRTARFQEGVSGNPQGRPKGSKNLFQLFFRVYSQKVQVKLPGGGLRAVTKLEAALMQLVNKAAQGDLRALREFIALVQRSEEIAASGGTRGGFNELDRQVIEGLKRRIASIKTNNNPEEENSK